jgi:AraC-like DNA-binding protein
VHHDRKLVMADHGPGPNVSLRSLRQELGRSVEDKADVLSARFDRYLHAVALHCGHRVEPARGHLEAGFERVIEPLVTSGALDQRAFVALSTALDRATAEAHSITDLLAAYRRAMSDIGAAILAPVPARQDRSLRAAFDYIKQHYTERLRLPQVARIAGFTPSHFSKLFIQREGTPFEYYVRRLRLERAKQMLSRTQLSAKRIGELCGFGSVHYFYRVFQREVGVAPLSYRKEARVADHQGKKLRPKKTNQNSLKGKARK